MSYIGKNPKVDSVKLDGSAAVPSGTAQEGQIILILEQVQSQKG